VTSFATELATPSVTGTLPRLIYKDTVKYNPTNNKDKGKGSLFV